MPLSAHDFRLHIPEGEIAGELEQARTWCEECGRPIPRRASSWLVDESNTPRPGNRLIEEEGDEPVPVNPEGEGAFCSKRCAEANANKYERFKSMPPFGTDNDVFHCEHPGCPNPEYPFAGVDAVLGDINGETLAFCSEECKCAHGAGDPMQGKSASMRCEDCGNDLDPAQESQPGTACPYCGSLVGKAGKAQSEPAGFPDNDYQAGQDEAARYAQWLADNGITDPADYDYERFVQETKSDPGSSHSMERDQYMSGVGISDPTSADNDHFDREEEAMRQGFRPGYKSDATQSALDQTRGGALVGDPGMGLGEPRRRGMKADNPLDDIPGNAPPMPRGGPPGDPSGRPPPPGDKPAGPPAPKGAGGEKVPHSANLLREFHAQLIGLIDKFEPDMQLLENPKVDGKMTKVFAELASTIDDLADLYKGEHPELPELAKITPPSKPKGEGKEKPDDDGDDKKPKGDKKEPKDKDDDKPGEAKDGKSGGKRNYDGTERKSAAGKKSSARELLTRQLSRAVTRTRKAELQEALDDLDVMERKSAAAVSVTTSNGNGRAAPASDEPPLSAREAATLAAIQRDVERKERMLGLRPLY